jgi:putative transcriptional regulator
MYESGMGAMIDAALRMEEFLELPIIEPIDPFTFKSKERLEEQREAPQSLEGTFALQQLSSLGFNVRPVVRSPFEAVSTNDKALMLTSLGSDEEKVMERAIVASELSRIMDRFSVLIVEKKRERDNINNTAIVSNEELKKIDEPNELTDLVEERRTKR